MRRSRFVAVVFAVVLLLALSGVAIADSWASNSRGISQGVALRGAQIDLPFEGFFDSPNEPPIYTMAGLEGRADLWGPNPTVGNLRGKLSIGGGPENAWRFSVFPIGPIEDKQYEDPGFEDCLRGLTPPDVEFFAGLDRMVFLNIVSRALRGTGALDWHREIICHGGDVHERDSWGLSGALVSFRQTGFLKLGSPGLPIEADLAITHFEVIAPPEAPANTPFKIEVFEEVTNFGPDGPALGAVAQFLFPPKDCQTEFAITPDLLAFAGGTVSVQHDGVVTVYTAPIVVHGPPGTEHIGPIFTIPIGVGEVIPITESWTVECANPSNHQFLVEKFFNPIDVRDPDLGNNELFTVVDVAVIGTADIELVTVEFPEPTPLFDVGGSYEIPTQQVIRNNGPDGPVEVEVIADFSAELNTPLLQVTQELLDLAGGQVHIVMNGDEIHVTEPILAPDEFTADPGSTITLIMTIRIPAGEEVVVEELFGVWVNEPGAFTLALNKQADGLHVEDPFPDNNRAVAFTDVFPAESDLAILSMDVSAPATVDLGEEFVVDGFEEIINYGPAPAHVAVNQVLFLPPDCIGGSVITSDLLTLGGGTVNISIDGVHTTYTDTMTVYAPPGSDHIGPVFGTDIGPGEVIPIAEQWVVSCENTSNHQFSVGKFLDPVTVPDPDLANNEGHVGFDVTVMGIADVASLSVDFGPLPPELPLGVQVDVPITHVVRNNGPDGPIEVEVGTNFVPFGMPSSVHVTPELLALAGGQVNVTFRFEDGSFDEQTVTEPGDFFMSSGGGFLGLNFVVRVGVGEELPIEMLFDVTADRLGPHLLHTDAGVFGIHVEDPNPGNDNSEQLKEVGSVITQGTI